MCESGEGECWDCEVENYCGDYVNENGDGGGLVFFQAEDDIRDAQESRGLGDVYKRQSCNPLVALFRWLNAGVRHWQSGVARTA